MSEGKTENGQGSTEPLKISKMTMTADGILSLLFSKDVLWPKMNLDAKNGSAQRELKARIGYKIEDIVFLKLQDDGIRDQKDLEKTKFNFTLQSYEFRSLNIKIAFDNTKVISTDLTFPDSLIIGFSRPDLIIDAETLLPLKGAELTWLV